MIVQDETKRKFLEHLFRNFFLLSLILLFLEGFTKVIINKYISVNYLFFLVIIFGFFWFFFYMTQNVENFKKKFEPIFKWIFLIAFFLLTIGSLKFSFFLKDEFFGVIIRFLSQYMFYNSILVLFFGFLTFYLNKNKIENEIIKEKENVVQKEYLRENEFDKKYPLIAKFNIDYNITYHFKNRHWISFLVVIFLSPFVFFVKSFYKITKSMYKEGWGYSWSLFGIFILFLVVKFSLPLIYSGSFIDEYYHIFSALDFLEHGHFAQIYVDQPSYLRGLYVTLMGALFLSFFGKNLFVIKLVPITIGIFNFILLYFIARKINLKKCLILLLMIIYTISPWVLFNHFYFRMYVFYEFFFLLVTFLFLNYFVGSSKSRTYKNLGFLLIFLVCLFFYLFSNDSGKYVLLFYFLLFFIFSFLFGKKISFFGNIFLKPLFRCFLLVFLCLFFIYFFDGLGYVKFLFEGELTYTSAFKYDYFFFDLQVVWTTLFLLNISFLFFNNFDLKYKFFFSSVIVLFLVHCFSSPDLQLVRGILYFFPLFYLLGIYALNLFLGFKKYKIFLIFFLFVSLFMNIPSGFFIEGPNLYEEINYIDYFLAYDFVREKCNFVFEASPSPYISSFYDVDIIGILVTTSVFEKDSQFYGDFDGNYKLVYDDTLVYTSLDDVLAFKGQHTCLVVRKPSKSYFLDIETRKRLAFFNSINFKNIEVFILN